MWIYLLFVFGEFIRCVRTQCTSILEKMLELSFMLLNFNRFFFCLQNIEQKKRNYEFLISIWKIISVPARIKYFLCGLIMVQWFFDYILKISNFFFFDHYYYILRYMGDYEVRLIGGSKKVLIFDVLFWGNETLLY